VISYDKNYCLICFQFDCVKCRKFSPVLSRRKGIQNYFWCHFCSASDFISSSSVDCHLSHLSFECLTALDAIWKADYFVGCSDNFDRCWSLILSGRVDLWGQTLSQNMLPIACDRFGGFNPTILPFVKLLVSLGWAITVKYLQLLSHDLVVTLAGFIRSGGKSVLAKLLLCSRSQFMCMHIVVIKYIQHYNTVLSNVICVQRLICIWHYCRYFRLNWMLSVIYMSVNTYFVMWPFFCS